MRNIVLLSLSLLLFLPFWVVAEENIKTIENHEPISKKNENQQTLKIEQIPDLLINLQTPTNWYLLLLPFITIAFVLGSTVITIKTIKIRTDEAKQSFIESLKTQREISENEVRATVLSNSREKWINSLRDELSEFISALHQIDLHLDLDGKKPADSSLVKFISELELKAAKIILLINPNEEKHKELIDLVEQATSTIGEDREKLYKLNKEIITLSQKILKQEWEVLKKFK